MVCHGGFSLDEKVRRTWYNPEVIINDVGLKKGMTFADVGSGEGFFSLLAAELVGSKGKVYAVDSDGDAIARLKLKTAERGLTNVHAVTGEAENTLFCRGCIDIVFFSMVLHDFRDPIRVLQNARDMLKASGIVVDLDWKKTDMPFGPPVRIRFNEEKAQDLLRQAGFRIARILDAGPYHYLVTAKL